jgi:hypothetical protein
VHAHEVVIGEVQGHGSPKILDLRKAFVSRVKRRMLIRHGQVLTFNQTRGDVSRIGVTCNYGTFGTDNARPLLALLRKM